MLARYRQQLTLHWMAQHPIEVLHLMWMHVATELQPRRGGLFRWLLPLAAVAAIILWRYPATWVVTLVVASNIMSIAMTYSAGGRFMLPVQPLLVALVAAMAVYLVAQVLRFARSRSSAGATPRASS